MAGISTMPRQQRQGDLIIKAAGNMAWPMGFRTERLARETRKSPSSMEPSSEHVAGLGSDPMTMIGAGAR